MGVAARPGGDDMRSTTTSETEQRGHIRAYTLLSTTALCWAGNAIAGKFAVGEVSPMLLVFLRWLLTFALLAGFGWRQLQRDWPELRPRLGFAAAMGALGFTAFNALFYVAAHYTTALNIGIIQGAMPALVLLGALAIHRTRIGGFQIIGVVVTMAGVAVVVSAGDPGRFARLAFNLGDLLILLSGVLYAGYTVALRDKPPVSPVSLFIVMAASAFVVSIPLVIGEAMLGQVRWPTAQGWVVTGYVVVFPSFLGQIFWMKGVGLIGPGRAGVFINLVPVFAAGLAVMLLAETFALYHLAGLVLVLGGIWLAERARK